MPGVGRPVTLATPAATAAPNPLPAGLGFLHIARAACWSTRLWKVPASRTASRPPTCSRQAGGWGGRHKVNTSTPGVGQVENSPKGQLIEVLRKEFTTFSYT